MNCSKCNLSFKNKGGLSQHEKNCCLNELKIVEIRNIYLSGKSIKELSTEYDTSQTTIIKIIGELKRSIGEAKVFSAKKQIGKKHTEESKQKMREFRLKWMKDNPEKTAWRTSNLSYPEKLFLNKIKELKLYEIYLIVREKSIFPYFIDFAFINEKIAVEIDGSQHELVDKKENDIKKDKLLNELGWRVIRFTASEINRNIDGCIFILNKFIKSDIKHERVGLYHNNEHKNIEIVCENCKNISYKKTIKKNKSGNYFCSTSCSTIFGNKNTLKFKKKEICKKETFEQEINLPNKNFRKVERPSYDELIENITKLGYAGTGRKHNVSPTSVRKWLKMYEKYGENF
jgi:very-short-patch-repair endonuclease